MGFTKADAGSGPLRNRSAMKIFCILSDQRAFRSKSPDLFSTVLNRVGIRGMYVPFQIEPDQIGQAIQSLRVLNIDGANVTVPYKEAVMPHLNAISEGATIIGAVNTIVRNGTVLKGYNTNAIGFMEALEELGFDVTGKTALVFGTGGAAKAVAFILNWLRVGSVVVAGRREERTKALIHRFGGEARSMNSLVERPVPAHLVVNTTSVSSYDESPELAALVANLELAGCELVFDLNYGRNQNFWQDMATSRGIHFTDGLPALAYQARRTFALWTGIQVDPREFLNAIASSGVTTYSPVEEP
jgi:shikimate dehydrogenase